MSRHDVLRIFLVNFHLEITERQRRLIVNTAGSLITNVIYTKSNFDSNIDVKHSYILYYVYYVECPQQRPSKQSLYII